MERDNIAQIDRIFHPRSIVVVGASNREGNLGRMFVEPTIQAGFEHLYVVNPRENEVLGLKSYPSLKDIPEHLDLAIIATGAQTVPQIINECAENGVAGAVVFTAGFSEAGEEGRKRERELVEVAHRGGIRIIGPNCVGIYCPSAKVANMWGLPTESGSVGMISQSGHFAQIFPTVAASKGVRFSKVVSCGNESDLNAADFLEYLGHDPETKLIIGYIEGIKEGGRFFKVARQVSMTKPILIWRGGLSQLGTRAASSHTGALTGSNHIWRALCKQAGVITVNSAQELLDLVLAFHYLPLPKGKRIGIVSSPGGLAVTACDACAEFGLSLAEFSPQVQQRLRQAIPWAGTSMKNPVDVSIVAGLAPELFLKPVQIVADNVDMVYIISGLPNQPFIDALVEAGKSIEKPLAVCLYPREAVTEEYLPLLRAGVAAYTDSIRGILALSRFADYSEFLRASLDDCQRQNVGGQQELGRNNE